MKHMRRVMTLLVVATFWLGWAGQTARTPVLAQAEQTVVPAALAAPTGAMTLTPVADTSVDSSSPTSNFGNGASLRVMAVRNINALLKWDPLESTCRHASLSIL